MNTQFRLTNIKNIKTQNINAILTKLIVVQIQKLKKNYTSHQITNTIYTLIDSFRFDIRIAFIYCCCKSWPALTLIATRKRYNLESALLIFIESADKKKLIRFLYKTIIIIYIQLE